MSEDVEAEALRLIDSGYRAVSNRYRMVSRIDRPDWLAHMAFSHTEGFPGSDLENLRQGFNWVAGLGEEACADHYRRCYSRDKLSDLNQRVFDLIRRAGNGHGWGGSAKYLPLIEKPRTT